MRPQDDALVVDTVRNKLGYLMEHEGPYVQLRPVTGVREGDAELAHVRDATEDECLAAMRERTRACNVSSSNGYFT